MLDAKIASALNKIIQSSQFKKKVSLAEQKAQEEDRFLRGRQIAFMIYEYFRVTLMRLFLIILIYFALLYMATTLKDLIPDVTKFLCRSNKYPQTISWKV